MVDYLTRFSGLKAADLDPTISTHYMLPLKIVYMKLRYLVDQGCVFVGHGLETDFGIVNIYVPPSQVRKKRDACMSATFPFCLFCQLRNLRVLSANCCLLSAAVCYLLLFAICYLLLYVCRSFSIML